MPLLGPFAQHVPEKKLMVGKRRWEIGIKIIHSTPSPASHLHAQ